MTTPFTNLLIGQTHKPTKPIHWNGHLDESIRTLKENVRQAPSLLLPYPSKPYEVETNGSDYVVGATLYQDGNLLYLRVTNLLQLNVGAQFKKNNFLLLYMHLSHGDITYLNGNRFVVTRDHQSLKYFCDQEGLTGCKAQWA